MKNIFKREKTNFKNDFGHVLVIAGSYNMPGAGVLCANSAISSGAGLVTFAFSESAYVGVCANIKPEIMLFPLQEKNGKLTKTAHKQVMDFIDKRNITSVVIGCGLGLKEKKFITDLIFSIIKKDIFVTIDADGLNALEGKQKNNIIKEFITAKAKIIITPHPKEFERISHIKYNSDDKYRKEITKTFAKNNNIICVLKGYKTVVSDGKIVYVNNTGNPGMATAGSGDVLAGMISAIVCNKETDLLKKVSTAVYLHGLAGDIAAKEKTETCLTSSDIIANLPKAILKELK